jgi:hypothetical protein
MFQLKVVYCYYFITSILHGFEESVNKKKGVEMTPFRVESREDVDFQTLQKYFDLKSFIG